MDSQLHNLMCTRGPIAGLDPWRRSTVSALMLDVFTVRPVASVVLSKRGLTDACLSA